MGRGGGSSPFFSREREKGNRELYGVVGFAGGDFFTSPQGGREERGAACQRGFWFGEGKREKLS